MDVNEIRQIRNAHPFGRFTLELDDGGLLPVENAFQLGISPAGKELTYASRKNGFRHLPVTKVTRIHRGIITEKAS